MEILKIAALALVICIAAQLLRQLQPTIGLVMAIAACVCLGLWTLTMIQPLVVWLNDVSGYLSGQAFSTLLKCVGIAVVSQIVQLVCHDAGQEAMGSMVELAGRVLTLLAALPLLRTVLSEILKLMQ